MILYKLKVLENQLDPDDPDQAGRLVIVRGLLRLFLTIDFSSETLLDSTPEKLIAALAYTQGYPLSVEEQQEIKQLMP